MTFQINAQTIMGLLGPSGAGKSTVVDLILGLLQPNAGEILVDGIDRQLITNWHNLVGYVPQKIALTGNSIAENIAFGVKYDSIDRSRIWDALEMSKLADFVRSLPNGIWTLLGEQGSRLSGGQAQRMGIARALYRQPKLVVFDEPTSALDVQTEVEIMQTIQELRSKATILLIAHRLSTLSVCDTVIYLKNGEVLATGALSKLESECEEIASLISLSREGSQKFL